MPSLASNNYFFAFAAILLSFFSATKAQSPPFTSIPLGCVSGFSGPNCPQKWSITGGPGNVGERQAQGGTKMICSASCTDPSNAKVCSHIVAMHGTGMTIGLMEWVMLGSESSWATTGVFDESNATGGPFCISFHKAAATAWDYTCYGDDADHIEKFIFYALDNYPIDPDAVNLHGFSSGAVQTNHLMNTRCSIEPLISAAAPYAAGHVSMPPTTKAAYLIAHGTHDDVVNYAETFVNGGSVPSCECSPYGSCTNNKYYSLQAEALAASIAKLRGYPGEVLNEDGSVKLHPPTTSKLDLITENVATCNENIAKCISLVKTPNPYNDGWDCASVGVEETDVVEYPINTSDSSNGPVVLWRMNLHDHNYPDKRRGSGYGPTEFFFQLKIFFNNNRGRGTFPPSVRIVTQETGTKPICTNPHPWDETNIPLQIFGSGLFDMISSKEECRQMCEDEKRCNEAFYYARNKKICQLILDPYTCTSTSDGSWADAARFTVTTSPTPPPTPPSPPPPTAPQPSPPPIQPPPPSDSICTLPEVLTPDVIAGYSCNNGDDSNFGGTEAACLGGGYTWTAYSCQAAEDYLLTVTNSAIRDALIDVWDPKCCRPSSGFCILPEVLSPNVFAGYACLVNEAPIADSNFGGTDAECQADGGEWTAYSCQAAEDYLPTHTDMAIRDAVIDVFEPICCVSAT